MIGDDYVQKAGAKTRDIQFYSEKNKQMVCVHTKQARDYAKYLEGEAWVESYETGRVLEMERYKNVSPVGIRSRYFATQWASDFFLHYADGRCGIREIVTSAEDLKKRAVIEQLELSRRYWKLFNVDEWKIVLMDE